MDFLRNPIGRLMAFQTGPAEISTIFERGIYENAPSSMHVTRGLAYIIEYSIIIFLLTYIFGRRVP